MIYKYHIIVITAYETIKKGGKKMITIRDVSKKAAENLFLSCGTDNFTKSPEEVAEHDIYDKISCSDKVSIAFHPRYGYVLLESDTGQAELYTDDFSTITIL